MSIAKDVSRGVAPYLIPVAAIAILWIYRDKVVEWLRNLVPGLPDDPAGNAAKTYLDKPDDEGNATNTFTDTEGNVRPLSSYDTADYKADWQVWWKKYISKTDISLPVEIWSISHLTPGPASNNGTPFSDLVSTAVMGSGVISTGTPSVMAPLTDPIGGIPADMGIQPGRYYKGDMMLEVTAESIGVFKSDPRYAGVNNEGWANVWFGGGQAKYNATGQFWLNEFGVV